MIVWTFNLIFLLIKTCICEHLQFNQLYTESRALTFIVPNECGVDKFLCSTLRPSQLKYTEFFNWDGPTKFLPGYLMYEPLEDPLKFPKYIASPLTVLQVSISCGKEISCILNAMDLLLKSRAFIMMLNFRALVNLSWVMMVMAIASNYTVFFYLAWASLFWTHVTNLVIFNMVHNILEQDIILQNGREMSVA